MTQLFDLTGMTLPAYDGGTLTFSDYRDRRAVLILGNQRNAGQVPEIAGRIHGAAETADAPVIQVAHLKGVPRAFRRLAERDIKRGVRSQVTGLRELRATRGLPVEDADHLLAMGLDWSGELTDRAGFTAKHRQPVTLLVDEHCQVVATAPGEDLVGAVRSFLQPTTNS